MDRVVPLAEFPRDPDDRRDPLMGSLMVSGAPRYFEVRIAIEPDLLQLADKVRDLLSSVQISTRVEGTELQNSLFAELRFGCWRKRSGQFGTTDSCKIAQYSFPYIIGNLKIRKSLAKCGSSDTNKGEKTISKNSQVFILS